MRYTYLLKHGFGFSNTYWDNLAALLDGDIEFFDSNFLYDEKKEYVGIGHSIGFLKLNNSEIKFDLLVGLQGFLNFCGSNEKEAEKRKGNLDSMITVYKIGGLKALKFFYDACGYTGALPNDINANDLIEDLNLMKRSHNHCGCKTIIIGSDKDNIVPTSIIDDNFKHINNVSIKYINDIGHSLGFHKPTDVANIINSSMTDK